MTPQVSGGYTGVAADGCNRRARSPQTTIQLKEEQRIGQLAGTIALRLVVTSFGIEIVPIDFSTPMSNAGGDHNPRSASLSQFGQKKYGQCEAAQMIHAELQLKALFRAQQRRSHH